MTPTDTGNCSARRKTRLTSYQNRTVMLPDGTSFQLKLDICVSVPMDAVLETTITRVGVEASRSVARPAAFGRMKTRNEHTPEIMP
jgi:hypothetical protein